MSPRPGRITATLPTDLPRQRTLAMMSTQPFFEAVNSVRDALFGNEIAPAAPEPASRVAAY